MRPALVKDHDAQRPAIGRAGIDGQAIAEMGDVIDDGMAMHDQGAVIGLIIQKAIPDP